MINELSINDAIDRLQLYVWCEFHPPSISISDFTPKISKIIGSYSTDNIYYNDTESVMIFELKDGKYAVAWENSDSTGHG